MGQGTLKWFVFEHPGYGMGLERAYPDVQKLLGLIVSQDYQRSAPQINKQSVYEHFYRHNQRLPSTRFSLRLYLFRLRRRLLLPPPD